MKHKSGRIVLVGLFLFGVVLVGAFLATPYRSLAVYLVKYGSSPNCVVRSSETVTSDDRFVDTGGTMITPIFDEMLWKEMEKLLPSYQGIILKDCRVFVVIGNDWQIWPVPIVSLTGIDVSGSSSDRLHDQNNDLYGITMGFRLLVIADGDTLTVRQVGSLYLHRNERTTVGDPGDTQVWTIMPFGG